jgi:UDPglucose 6-dehydrogenase
MTHRDILIIGYGIVGKAVYEGLNKDEMNYIQVLDPPKDMNILDDGINDYSDYGYYDGIIICLPTPQGPRGECDDMMVEQYHREIRAEAPGIPILIKSTISIELIKLLEDDLYLTFNPEFLTENDSIKEFCHQKFAIFGGENARYWYDIYINSGIKIDKVRFTSMINACYAKYAINCYLATKVIFFNELRDMYCDEGFDEVTELIALDERIGKSHMMVPGSDGKHGFGGMCLPKDTLAFATSASRKGFPLKLLEEAILINSKIREFYYSKIEDLPE